MRLLVATPWLFPHGGGLERYAHQVAAGLARQGHRVTMLGHGEGRAPPTGPNFEALAIKPSVKLSNTPLSLALRQEARRILREEHVDAVHVHTPVPGVAELVAHAARRAGVPYVVTYHAGVLAAPKGILSVAARLHRLGPERRMLKRAAGRLAVSPYVARAVFGRLSSTLAPPGVDTDRFRPVAPAVPGRILFVGGVDRAYAWKGLATLFDAFERLAPFHPEAHLRIVGSGDLVHHYRARAERAGWRERVHVQERVDDDALAREYSRASLVVLPSTSPAESFGMVLAEANACARPVVASDVGGIPSLVRHGENGLLAPPGDAPALADAISELLLHASRAREMGRHGRERILKEFRWENTIERTALALEAAISSRAA